MREVADGAVETELRERRGLSAAWSEARTPEQAFGLLHAERALIHGDAHVTGIGRLHRRA